MDILKNKQLLLIVGLLSLSGLFLWLGLPWMAGLLAGFLFGFMFAVNRVYKAATGNELTGKAEDEVYDKIL